MRNLQPSETHLETYFTVLQITSNSQIYDQTREKKSFSYLKSNLKIGRRGRRGERSLIGWMVRDVTLPKCSVIFPFLIHSSLIFSSSMFSIHPMTAENATFTARKKKTTTLSLFRLITMFFADILFSFCPVPSGSVMLVVFYSVPLVCKYTVVIIYRNVLQILYGSNALKHYKTNVGKVVYCCASWEKQGFTSLEVFAEIVCKSCLFFHLIGSQIKR